MDALLGYRRDSRNKLREALANDAVGGKIRLRHRRSIVLAVDLHGLAVDGQNGRPGPDHQIGQGSISAAAASRSITRPGERASFMG